MTLTIAAPTTLPSLSPGAAVTVPPRPLSTWFSTKVEGRRSSLPMTPAATSRGAKRKSRRAPRVPAQRSGRATHLRPPTAQLVRRDPLAAITFASSPGLTIAAHTRVRAKVAAQVSTAERQRQRRRLRPRSAAEPNALEQALCASTPPSYGRCSRSVPQQTGAPRRPYRRVASRPTVTTLEHAPTTTTTPTAEAIIPRHLWASPTWRPRRRKRRRRRALARSRTLPFYLISGALLTSVRSLSWSVNLFPVCTTLFKTGRILNYAPRGRRFAGPTATSRLCETCSRMTFSSIPNTTRRAIGTGGSSCRWAKGGRPR